MNVPKVSIGLPVWNGEKYLRLALQSILQQDYADFELIISDNASADGTPEICQEFAAKDKRIRYSRNQTNIGARGNYNRVFELARGEFFKWASHDDEIHMSLLRRCFESFEHSAPNTVLVFSKAEIIDENQPQTRREFLVTHQKPDSSFIDQKELLRRLPVSRRTITNWRRVQGRPSTRQTCRCSIGRARARSNATARHRCMKPGAR